MEKILREELSSTLARVLQIGANTLKEMQAAWH